LEHISDRCQSCHLLSAVTETDDCKERSGPGSLIAEGGQAD
jgi:hypothetical protein